MGLETAYGWIERKWMWTVLREVCVNVVLFSSPWVDQLLSESTEEESKPVVNFVFLTRSGNKQQYNSVEMPVDSELVTKLRTREEVFIAHFVQDRLW